MLAGKRAELRRVLAPRLWRVGGEKGRALIDAALSDPDASTRAGAMLSLALSQEHGKDEKTERFLEGLSDPDEFVRINAASSLRELGASLGGHADALCAAYDRNLTAMETLAALMLLAEAGAACLQEPVERLLKHPSSASMGAAIEAVRIGLDTGAVTVTDELRAGLGHCAVGGYVVLSRRAVQGVRRFGADHARRPPRQADRAPVRHEPRVRPRRRPDAARRPDRGGSRHGPPGSEMRPVHRRRGPAVLRCRPRRPGSPAASPR
jgi:hypothetical protein